MPTTTYTPIANTTLGSSATSITFSSISQSYRDLVLVINGPAMFGDVSLRLNSDSGNNYSYVVMYGTGSSSLSGQASSQSLAAISYNAASSPFSVIVNFLDYSATDKHKTLLSRGNQADAYVLAYADRWANTAAITSIQILNNTYPVGTTLALYGVAA